MSSTANNNINFQIVQRGSKSEIFINCPIPVFKVILESRLGFKL